MTKVKLLSFVVLIFLWNTATAQQIELSGQVTDAETGEELGFATICIIDSMSRNILFQTAADDCGRFHAQFNHRGDTAAIYAKASFIGYHSATRRIPLHCDTLCLLALYPDAQQIEEIMILSEAKAISNSGGKIVIDVAKFPNVDRIDLAKMLTRLPGVQNTEGVFTLMGQKAAIFINGVQQTMSISALTAYLKSLPAEAVKKIELNSLPSSRYDADIDAVIEIELREDAEDGIMGQAKMYVSAFDGGMKDAGASAFVLLNKRNITFNTNLSYSNDDIWRRSDGKLYFADRKVLISEKNRSDGRNNVVNSTSNLSVRTKDGGCFNTNVFIYYDRSAKEDRWRQNILPGTVTDSRFDGNGSDDLYSVSLQYNSPKEKEWTWRIKYEGMYGGLRSWGDYFQHPQDDTAQKYMESSARMTGHSHALSADFTNKLSRKIRLNYGTELAYSALQDQVTNFYMDNSENYFSNFKGSETAAKLYAELTWKIATRWSLMAGGRFESINYNLNIISNQTAVKDSYNYLYPQIQLNYNGEKYDCSLSYKGGIIRPNYEQMLPGQRYVNAYYYTVGEPGLVPTRYYALRFNQTLFNFIYLNLIYHQNKHASGTLLMIDPNETKLYSKALNYGDAEGFGAYLDIYYQLFGEKLYGSLSGMARYITVNNLDPSLVVARKSYWTSQITFNANYDVTKCLSLELGVSYQPGQKGLQATSQDFWQMSAGASYAFLKKTLIVGFSCSNITGHKQTWLRQVLGDSYWTKNLFRKRNIFEFSVTYKFQKGSRKIKDKYDDYTPSFERFGK